MSPSTKNGQRATSHYSRRHRNKRLRRNEAHRLGPFTAAFSRSNLYKTYGRLRAANGQSPGADDFAYDDISPVNLGCICNALSIALNGDCYQPAPVRVVRVPKSRPGEFRLLKLPAVLDRVVAAALQHAVQPYWEQVFLPGSWGFRPGRSPLGMLAALDAAMRRTGRWVIALDDIANAFDNVSVERVVSAMRPYFDDAGFRDISQDAERFLQLSKIVLAGNPRTAKGIGQGNPYSPIALNVLLHAAHDIPLEQSGAIWFRYADNLCYLCQTNSEGTDVIDRSRTHLRNEGLALRGSTIVDLRESRVPELLGFGIVATDDGIRLHPADSAWSHLQTKLSAAHESPYPAATVQFVTQGWVDAYGAAFEHTDELLPKLLTLAARYGFRELYLDRLITAWNRARTRWERLQAQAWAT